MRKPSHVDHVNSGVQSIRYNKMANLIKKLQMNTEISVSHTAVAGRHEGFVADSEG